MRSLCIFVLSLLFFSCASTSTLRPEQTNSNTIDFFAEPTPSPALAPEDLGVTIDQQFAILSDHGFSDENYKGKTFRVDALGMQVEVSNFAPKTIRKDSNVLFRFKTRHPNDYWSNLIGVSHLLGPNSNEIYAVSTGPGAVCCTNYWIMDVSSGKPRSIFRSEDFGNFREPMEIFDADRDGVYELVHFDSCFRYFMDDCGACAPEPRAYFKYDKNLGQYRPARGIMEDFVREGMMRTEKSVAEKFASLQDHEDPGAEFDLQKMVLSHFVDLLHVGEEKKAWVFFKKYHPNRTRKEMQEIQRRLANCKFYQALRKNH